MSSENMLSQTTEMLSQVTTYTGLLSFYRVSERSFHVSQPYLEMLGIDLRPSAYKARVIYH